MINVYFTFRDDWLLWTQNKFGVFTIYKLDNHTFIISGAVTSQKQTVTTFDICRIYYNVGIFTNLNNMFFKIIIRFEIPDISTLFLLLYCSALACNFSRLTIRFSRLTLTFLTITNSLYGWHGVNQFTMFFTHSICIRNHITQTISISVIRNY